MLASDVIDLTTEAVPGTGLHRVKVTCSDHPAWGVGFPALPANVVTLTKVIGVAAEHLDREHASGTKLPDVPILNVEDNREPVGANLPRNLDAIGPLGE